MRDGWIDRINEVWRKDRVHLMRSGRTVALDLDGHIIERPAVWFESEEWPRKTSDLARFDGHLLIGERVPASVATAARQRGIWWIDAYGNAYVEAPGVRIDIRGRRAKTAAVVGPGRERVRETNLMSARRAQVVLCLLAWPRLVTASVRALADAAGVSTSLAHSAVAALSEEGYVVPGVARLFRANELLDQWTAAYPLALARALELGRFSGQPVADAWAQASKNVFVSGEAAVDELHGRGLVIYVPRIDPRAVARSRWERPWSDEESNIVVRRAFWTEPERAQPQSETLRIAPLPLVYADLMASREPRQQEIARGIRREILSAYEV
ncbi:hypothetical protein DBB34_03630 [Sphaerisporangium cinnabarinum]|nr:type IV toxin-antitoxin system AbiEi family antitoxin [Sphaerisporangium cinnabarinum]PTU57450.1 hypothetical protein DBB34_03630 [Sphaerisporangium cinnabarinum]